MCGSLKWLFSKQHRSSRHWVLQRLSAVVLIPISSWFAYSYATLVVAPYGEVCDWFSSLGNLLGMIILIPILFYHGAIGIQVIWEDYVHTLKVRNWLILITKLLSWVMIILSLYSLISLYSKGWVE